MGYSEAALLLTAVALDLLFGDPRGIPHPVEIIGRLIAFLERWLRHPHSAPWLMLLTGTISVGIVVAVSLIGTAVFLTVAGRWFGPTFAWLLAAWVLSSTIAIKGLAQAAESIAYSLDNGDLAACRQKLGLIVGRDTEGLSQEEIARATIETVAENSVDGVISPLFYGILGGPALAMAYKAINTLDSMIGYRNKRYLFFGRSAARLDDIANFLPARLTGLILPPVAWLIGEKARDAWYCIRDGSRNHPSPNSGIPEAGFAGALGLRLGGVNYYAGVQSFRAYLGQGACPSSAGEIRRAVRLMWAISLVFALIGAVLLFLTGGILAII